MSWSASSTPTDRLVKVSALPWAESTRILDSRVSGTVSLFGKLSYARSSLVALTNSWYSIVMIGTLTGLQWMIYDSFKIFMGLPTTGSSGDDKAKAKA